MLELEEKQATLLKEGRLLPLMEQFYTIQGEGFHTGKAAWFIRLGGCDVGCHWCDVKESWDVSRHPLTKSEDIIRSAMKDNPSKTVVMTGGEPLMYNLDYLCSKLKECGLQIHLETSGAYPLSGQFDWICLSPKKNEPPLPEVLEKANELKVIVYNQDDFNWAERHSGMVSEHCKLYLQPEWSRAEKLMPKIVDYVMQNPKWMISLQSHKFMHIP